jgi:hypothetical protein
VPYGADPVLARRKKKEKKKQIKQRDKDFLPARKDKQILPLVVTLVISNSRAELRNLRCMAVRSRRGTNAHFTGVFTQDWRANPQPVS